MFKKLHIISLPYKYQIPLLRPPGFVLYHSSVAIKGNLSRSSQTERDQSKNEWACVLQRFLQAFFFFFLHSKPVFVSTMNHFMKPFSL